ncbi:hypothetical protein BH24ACT15_BH24ACT15_20620 [soil metagenome]
MTNTWRMLAPGPFFMPLATRAVWAGDRMIVVTHDQTVAYDPAVDMWTTISAGIHLFDPDGRVWTEVEPIPIGGSKGPSGPVFLDTDFLIPRWGRAALFDTSTHTWTEIVLPGGGDEHEMVWTGQELLMWGAACCDGRDQEGFTSIDAWHWPLPN